MSSFSQYRITGAVRPSSESDSPSEKNQSFASLRLPRDSRPARLAGLKVHRGQLRRHSEVFDDLFSIPQLKDQDLCDGWPWVEVYDCPSDVLYLLRALYDGLWALGVVPTSPLSLPSCASPPSISSSTSTNAAWPTSRSTGCPPSLPGTSANKPPQTPSSTTSRAPPASRSYPAPLPRRSPLPCPPRIPAYASHTRAAHKPTLPVPALLRTTFCRREAVQAYLAVFISTHLHARAPAPLCAYLEDEPPAWHACRKSFYFIMRNVLRSVGGIACGRDADPLFTLLQAVEMRERTDFSDGTRMCGLRMCAVSHFSVVKTKNVILSNDLPPNGTGVLL
ncbi:hypothetical protein B0H14DRAFT_3594045 [Mycena olivaceomarginata]|nr:hypothetical protein B0H14DRAFT_3594045 [Mycena olivaceomarginata]